MDLNTIKEIISIITSVLGTLTVTTLSIVLLISIIMMIKNMKEQAKRDAESDRLFREAVRRLEEDTNKLIENAEKESKKKKEIE